MIEIIGKKDINLRKLDRKFFENLRWEISKWNPEFSKLEFGHVFDEIYIFAVR